MKTDFLIVGAGLTGATLAERLASLGKRVLVVDRREHIAGNAYDEYDAHGVLVHRYGPHIFHTNSKKVWDYLSQFTEWRPYYHRALGVVDGKMVPIPFNLQSLRLLFPARMADLLEEKLVRRFGLSARVPILRLKEEGDEDLKLLAEYVYEKVFLGYTLKQWGVRPEELSPSVTARVPVLVSYDDRYFQDIYQAMPAEGYTAMVRRMLRHPNIRVLLQADWKDVKEEVRYKKLIFTGPIDEFFGYKYGPLPYRSLSFHFQTLPVPWHQRAGTVNYPNEHLHTRVTEFKHLTGQGYLPHTTVAYEYPEAYEPGRNEPYYPVPREENEALYRQYLEEGKELEGVYFAGRLGDYRYYNMDQAVARALKLFEEIIHE